MEATLTRKIFTPKSIIGDLVLQNFQCKILEDADRHLSDDMPLEYINQHKMFGQTAIPYGRYEIVITKSERFSKMLGHDVFLPLLKNVKGYEGVRIHSGNRPEDTEGCLLTGVTYGTDSISESRKAFNELFPIIENVLKTDRLFLTIKKI